MRVDGKSGFVEGVAQYHVRGFAADSGQCGQFLHRIGHCAVISFAQVVRESDDVFRFGAVEADGMDDVLNLFGIGGLQVGGSRKPAE